MRAVVGASAPLAVTVPPRMGSSVVAAAFLPGSSASRVRRGDGEAGRRSAAGTAPGARGRGSEPRLLLPALGWLQRGPRAGGRGLCPRPAVLAAPAGRPAAQGPEQGEHQPRRLPLRLL